MTTPNQLIRMIVDINLNARQPKKTYADKSTQTTENNKPQIRHEKSPKPVQPVPPNNAWNAWSDDEDALLPHCCIPLPNQQPHTEQEHLFLSQRPWTYQQMLDDFARKLTAHGWCWQPEVADGENYTVEEMFLIHEYIQEFIAAHQKDIGPNELLKLFTL